ncbi:MAG TPA: hypothetical protein VG797_10850 [Phycisphaerales bacterium]|nr:hypothetical protein [Phycisphaerales bacterium]
MPAFTRLRISALEEFARQQRFTPARALRRQVEQAESLAREIEPDGAYPEDWLIFRLTGYRAEVEEPSIIVGEALLADLSAFVERLSAGAGYTERELGNESLALAELRARWGVTPRTIERYRRRGLLARRALSERKRPSLRFMRAEVERFEGREAERLDRARSASRVGEGERHELHRRATGLRAHGVRSVGGAAKEVARDSGRSISTVRRAVVRIEAAAAVKTFETKQRTAPERKRELVAAVARGERPGRVAAQARLSRASVHRITNEQRAAILRGLDLRGPTAEEGGSRGTLDSATVRSGLGAPAALDPGAFVADATEAGPPSAREERERASAYHTLKANAGAIIAALPRFNPSAARLDEAETMLRWASLIKVELVRSQSGLVLRSIEERLAGTGGAGRAFLSLPRGAMVELHRIGFDAVIAGVERFDPFKARPGRLAAPVGVELARALAGAQSVGERSMPRVGAAAKRLASSYSTALEDWTTRVTPWRERLDPPAGLREKVAVMNGEPARWLAARFGWDGSPPRTLARLNEEFGVTATKFAHALRRALRD